MICNVRQSQADTVSPSKQAFTDIETTDFLDTIHVASSSCEEGVCDFVDSVGVRQIFP